jgi:glycosyltransferase involved in cell wall biosynthesis
MAAYQRAADFLNVNTVDVVSVQHEYGIFGGKAGAHVLALLHDLRMPVVTTLHTILATPDPHQRRVMDDLTHVSERLVVMSAQGATLLRDTYGVPDRKIDVIPHGIPSVPSASASKDRLGVDGKAVLLTFGLLSPDKGIEYVIDALPAILGRFPQAVYIVLGATHPHIRERHGEAYRVMLETRALQLGVADRVIFHNRFVGHDELTEFLAAADLYVTPSLQPEQTTSGTLAYAVGSGKAVISTPYVYARELLADGRGVLVPWRDADGDRARGERPAGDDAARLALGQRAAAHGRAMTWPGGTGVPGKLRAGAGRARRPAPDVVPGTDARGAARGAARAESRAPPPHDRRYGAAAARRLQRAAVRRRLLSRRQRAGAAAADAGRGCRHRRGRTVRAVASRYLAFVNHAFSRRTGRRFRNFMSYERRWTETTGSEDSHGRAVWALGAVVGPPGRSRTAQPGRRFVPRRAPGGAGVHEPARVGVRAARHRRIPRGVPGRPRRAGGAGHPRRTAARPVPPDERTAVAVVRGPRHLLQRRMPQALLVSGARMDDPRMIETGARALDWLVSIQHSPDGYFAPVGSNGVERGTPAVPSTTSPSRPVSWSRPASRRAG